MTTKIALPRYARIGAGAVNDLGEIVQDLGSRRPAVITDAFLAGNGDVYDVIGERGGGQEQCGQESMEFHVCYSPFLNRWSCRQEKSIDVHERPRRQTRVQR